jgi:2-dehydro-3-deoxygluconokinase
MSGLVRISSSGAIDFLSVGALVMRLDPGVVPFRKANRFDVHVSGGEFNVAANLADCFRLNTAIASAMVDYPIGELIAERVRAMGVRSFYKHFAHDGVRGPNMAAVFSDRGFGARAPVVFYNRSDEAAARLKPGDFDWDRMFSGGIRWLHSGGIFAALSKTSGDLIVEASRAAKAAGAIVSFDLNFRPKLWRAWDGEGAASAVLGRIVEHVDVLVGNEEDLQLGLGIDGPTATQKAALDPAPFFEMIEIVAAKYRNLKVIATTLREVLSARRHRWSAVAWADGRRCAIPPCEIDIFDRVGGGDGFASGFFYGLMTGEALDEAVRLGWAHGALLATFPGDTTMATLEQVRAMARGESAKIQR